MFYKLLPSFLLSLFCCLVYAQAAPDEGSALTFQAMLVDENGVPYGAEEPEEFHMIFRITSRENGGTELWSSRPRLIQVDNGIFTVRIGKFYDDEMPLDEYVFTGNDEAQRKRFLHIEISTTGANGTYQGFYRKDLNPEFDITNVSSHIPISGVPFVISAIRIIGDDIKEGSLRITKDELEHEYDSTLDADLKIVATGNFDGLQIVQNRNIGMIIYNNAPSSGDPTDALVTKGAGFIQGTLFLRGERSNLLVDGSLSSIHKDHGILEVELKDLIKPAIQAGPLRSPVFKNPEGSDFFVSTTGLSSLHRVLVMDIDLPKDHPFPQIVTVETAYGSNITRLTDDASVYLTKGGFMQLTGTTEREVFLSSSSAGIEAIGFYDNRQPRADTDYFYQLVPHGLSVLNRLKMGASPTVGYLDAYRLIGEYMTDTQDWLAPRSDASNTRFHKHDLRIAADPDALVQRINQAQDGRIAKSRIDDNLAYIFADNIFINRNYMLGYGASSAFTDNRIIASFNAMNVFIGGDEPSPGLRRILLGMSTPELGHLAFLKCPTVRIPENNEFYYDCTNPDDDMLEVEGNILSAERSLHLSANLEVYGNITLLEDTVDFFKKNRGEFNFRYDAINIKSPLGAYLYATDYATLTMSNSTYDNRHAFLLIPSELELDTVAIVSVRYPDRYLYISRDLNNNANSRAELRKYENTPSFRENTSFIWHGNGGLANLTNGSSFEMAYSEYRNNYLYLTKSYTLTVVIRANLIQAEELRAATFVVVPMANTIEYPNIGPNHTLHYVKQKTTIEEDMVLITNPLINTSITVNKNIKVNTLEDTDSDLYKINPSGQSSINRATIKENLIVHNKLAATEIHDLKNIDVTGSVKISDTISSNIFLDKNNQSFFINPGPLEGEPPTRLSELHLMGNFHVESDLSIGTDFITTSDFSSSKDFILRGDYFETKETIYADRFIDNQSTERYAILSDKSKLLNLTLTNQLTGKNIFSRDGQTRLNIQGVVTARDITANETSSFRVWHTTLESAFVTDPNSHSIWHSLSSLGLEAKQVLVNDSAQFLYPSLVSGNITIGKTLTMRDSVLLGGEFSTIRTTDSTKVFSISTAGDVVARGVELQDTFHVEGDNSTVYLENGMEQKGRTGQNFFRHTIIYSDTNLYDSSLEVGEQAFYINSYGDISSKGQLDVSQSLLVGASGIDSTLYTNGNSLIFDSNSTEAIFFNFAHHSPLNVSANAITVKSVFSNNVLISPIVHSKNAPDDYFLNLNDYSNLYSLDIMTKDGIGGGAVLSGPLHFTIMHDYDQPELSLNPSAESTLTRLMVRQIRTPQGVIIKALDDQNVLTVLADNGSTDQILLQLDNDTFSLSADGQIISSASFTVTGQPFRLESPEGLVFSTSSHAIALSSENLFYLVGQKYFDADQAVYADHLHQHSEINGIPVTDLARRDIDNTFSAHNTFTASAWAIFLRPEQASNEVLLRQKDEDDEDSILLYGDGKLKARVFQGDGTHLSNIDGSIIKNKSITAHDFKTASLRGDSIQNNAVTTDKLRRNIIAATHIKDLAINTDLIKDKSFQADHFITGGLLNDNFAKEAFQSRHIAHKSITGDKIVDGTLTTNRIQTQAIAEEQIQSDNISGDKIISEQIRNYHIQDSSIHGYHFQAATLITIDLADDAISTSKIAEEAVTSGIVLDENINRSKIAEYTLNHEQIADHTLTNRVLYPEDITLDKIKPYSISSRDILDYTIQNHDFQNLGISSEKLADLSIKRRHFTSDSLDSLQLDAASIETRHFVTRTIQSNEILDLSLTEEAFRDHTINPTHIAEKSITDDHFIANAIGRDKIIAEGISIARFQPFAISSSQISAEAITAGNLQAQSILSEHIVNHNIKTKHVKDKTVDAEKIKNYHLLEENIDDFSIDTHNLLDNAVRTAHFVEEAVQSIDIATNTLTTEKFADLNIESRHIRDFDKNGGLEAINFADNSAAAGLFHIDSINADRIKPYSLIVSNFADQAVTSGKLANDTLTERLFINEEEKTGASIGGINVGENQILSSAIALLAVTEAQIKDESLLTRNFSADIVSAAKIATLTLINHSFADSSVQTANIGDGQINSRIVSDGGIFDYNIMAGQISSRALAPSTISSVSIDWGVLSSRLLQLEQITDEKIAPKLLITRVLQDHQITSSLIANYSITTDRIKPRSIESEHIVSGAITSSKLGGGIVTSGAVIDGSIIDTKLSSNFVSARVLDENSITSEKIRTATLGKEHFYLADIAEENFQNEAFYNYHFQDQQFFAEHIAASLPVTLFRHNSINGQKLAENSIVGSAVTSRSFYGQYLDDNVISHEKLAIETIMNRHFADQSLLTDNFADGAVENNHIAADSIETEHIKNRSLSAADIMTRSLSGDKFIANSVHGRAVGEEAITTDKIAAYAVSGSRFIPETIESGKLTEHFLVGRLLQEKTLTVRILQEESIADSHFAANFFFNADAIAENTITSEQISLKTIYPKHFADDEIGSGKFKELSGEKFLHYNIDIDKLAENSITGEKIITDTLGDIDHALIFLRSDQNIIKVRQRTAAETSIWTTDIDTDFTAVALEPQNNGKLAFTKGMELSTINVDSGEELELVQDFSVFWEQGADAPWTERNQFPAVTFNNQIWIMGGRIDGGGKLNDVWSFDEEGGKWTKVTDEADWSKRVQHDVIEFKGSMWLTGGTDGSKPLNDVWYSSTGSTWQKTGADEHTVLLITGEKLNANHDILDSSSESRSIGITGVTISSNKKIGENSLHFNGSSSYIEINDTIDLTGDSFTIEAWIRPTKNTSMSIFSQYTNDGNRWYLSLYYNGPLRLRLYQDDGADIDCKGPTVTSNQWQHIALVKQRGSSEKFNYDLYVGGQKTSCNDKANIKNNNNHYIGTRNKDYYFHGQIDELRISTTARYSDSFDPPEAPFPNAWPARQAHTSVLFKDKIWVFGGQNDDDCLSDIWSSKDGAYWNYLGDTFPVCRFTKVLSFSDKLWVFGGGTSTGDTDGTNQVWVSSDGINWLEKTAALWTTRDRHTAFVYRDKMWVSGGRTSNNISLNDTWFTEDGENWTELKQTSWPKRRAFASAVINNKVHIMGGYDPNILKNDVWFLNFENFNNFRHLNWEDEHLFRMVLQNDQGSTLYTYNNSTEKIYREAAQDLIFTAYHQGETLNTYLGITAQNKLFHSEQISFELSTPIAPDLDFQKVIFAPESNYIYATRKISDTEQRLLKIPWDGADNFSSPIDLTATFSDKSPHIKDFSLDPDGENIYLIANIFDDTGLYRVSASGSGLTTIEIAGGSPDNAIIALGGEKFNPFIPLRSITNEKIVNRSIDGFSLPDYILTTDHFYGIDGSTILTHSLDDYHFADYAFSASKWRADTITGYHLDDQIFDAQHIIPEGLSEQVIAQNSLTARVFKDKIFGVDHLIDKTLTIRVLQAEGFGTEHISLNEITADKIAVGALLGVHFTELSSAPIADNSLSKQKYQTRIFAAENLLDDSIYSEQIAKNSITADRFLTAQFSGKFIADMALSADLIATDTLRAVNIADDAVQQNNIAEKNILSQHFQATIFTSSQMDVGVISTRTLAPSAITSDLIEENAFSSQHFTTHAVTADAIAQLSINGDLLQEKIFAAQHFAAKSIQNSNKIVNESISIFALPFNNITENKLTGASITTNYLSTAAFRGDNLKEIDNNKIVDAVIQEHHIDTGTISTDKIKTADISSTKISLATLQERHFATDSLDDKAFSSDAVNDQKISTSAITDTKVEPSTITSSKFANNSLENDKLKKRTLTAELFTTGELISADKLSDIAYDNLKKGSIIGEHLAANEGLSESNISPNSLSSRLLSEEVGKFLKTDNFALKTISNQKITGVIQGEKLAKAGFKGENFAEAAFTSFAENSIPGDRLSDHALQTANLLTFTGKYFAPNSITSQQIENGAISGAKIKENSFSGDRFSGNITANKLASHGIHNDSFDDGAFNKEHLAENIDITDKVSLTADISTNKIKDKSITGDHLAAKINHESYIASKSVTIGKFSGELKITAEKVKDSSIAGDKIANDTIKGTWFNNESLSKNSFGSEGSADSNKIDYQSITSDKLATEAITSSKIATNSSLPGNRIAAVSTNNFAKKSFNLAEHISENSISTDKIAANAIDSISLLPTFSANKFTSLTGREIANIIFTDDHFENHFFSSEHFAEDGFSSVHFTETITGIQIADGSLTHKYIADQVITASVDLADQLTAGIFTGILIANFAKNSFINEHFNDQAIDSEKIKKDNWQGVFSDSTLSPDIHKHSLYQFKKPDMDGLTLLNDDALGRGQFAYLLSPDAANFTNAQTSCLAKNSLVCDTNQLLELRRRGILYNDKSYYAGDLSLVDTTGSVSENSFTTKYLIIPKLAYNSDDSLLPTTQSWDFYNSDGKFSPVQVSDEKTGVTDLVYFQGNYFILVGDSAYKGSWVGSDSVTLVTDLPEQAKFVQTKDILWTWNSSHLLEYNNGVLKKSDKKILDLSSIPDNNNNVVIYAHEDGQYLTEARKAETEETAKIQLGAEHRPISVQGRSHDDDKAQGYVLSHNPQTWTTETTEGLIAKESALIAYGEQLLLFGPTTLSSSNGRKWKEVVDTGGWTARSNPLAAEFDGNLWIFGGQDAGTDLHDFWMIHKENGWAQQDEMKDEYTRLLLHGEKTSKTSKEIVDSSGYKHNGTLEHTDMGATSGGKFNNACLSFNGSRKIDFVDNDDFKFGTGEFTIDFWMQATTISASENSRLISFGHTNDTYKDKFDIAINKSTKKVGVIWDKDFQLEANTAISTKRWYHIALTRDSQKLRLFIDGILEANINNSTSFSASGCRLGARLVTSSSTYYYTGLLDEVRISKGIARWTANFTKPIREYQVPFGWTTSTRLVSHSDDKLYALFADAGGERNNYYTNDGITWSLATKAIPTELKNITNHTVLSFNGKISILGGIAEDNVYNDKIFSLTNYSDSWTDAVAPWFSADGLSAVVGQDPLDKKDKLFVFGGQREGKDSQTRSYNDVWASEDAENWTKVDNASWSERYGGLTAYFRNKIWLVGGYVSDSSWENKAYTFTFPYTGNLFSYHHFDLQSTGNSEIKTIIRPSEWQQFSNYEYLLNSQSLDWEAAQKYCEEQNSSLASIHSTGENDFVATLCNGNKCWIGFNDQVSEGKFVWKDNSLADYTNWDIISNPSNPEPNDSNNEDCTEVSTTKLWNDLPCTGYPRTSICKRKIATEQNVNFVFCPKSNNCFIAKKKGDIIWTTSDDTTPTISVSAWSLYQKLGGENITEEVIVSMDASMNGQKLLYMLSKTGHIYTVQLDSNGKPTSTITRFDQDNEIPDANYKLNSARIHCTDGKDDEIIITGLEKHIIIRRENQKADYACCSPSFR